MKGGFPNMKKIWVDAGYKEQFVTWFKENCDWVVEIVTRRKDVVGFEVQPHRWLVERTLGWFNLCRRLSKDYEYYPETSEAMVNVASIRLMLRRLDPQIDQESLERNC
jgi:transposase